MKEIRILLADDHEVVRRGLRAILQAQPGWKVVAEAANGREAVELARQFKPAVVILDISMPEVNGFEATRQILKAFPKQRCSSSRCTSPSKWCGKSWTQAPGVMS